MDILEKEFVHIGTDKIYKELWQNINMDQKYRLTKPYGGLYCSNYHGAICDWLCYAEEEFEEIFDYISSLPACFIKLKKDTKLLVLNDKNDLRKLKENDLIINYEDNPIHIYKLYYEYKITFLPDYEKISNIYDAIYVNPNIDNAFKQYDFPTLLITNPNAIEYYKPFSYNNTTITEIKDKQKVTELNEDYFKYYKYIEKKFSTIDSTNYEEYIEKLNQLRNLIINDQNNLCDKLGFDINEKINSLLLLKTIANNVYREKYLSKQKVLHK